jgi:hypothetical protein
MRRGWNGADRPDFYLDTPYMVMYREIVDHPVWLMCVVRAAVLAHVAMAEEGPDATHVPHLIPGLPTRFVRLTLLVSLASPPLRQDGARRGRSGCGVSSQACQSWKEVSAYLTPLESRLCSYSWDSDWYR